MRPPTGRPREHGDENWLTVREAADILHVSEQAIRNRIKRGTIEYTQDFTEGSKQPSYRIARSAVLPAVDTTELDHRMIGRAERLENVFQQGVKEIASQIAKQREMVVAELKAQREELEATRQELKKQGEARHEQFEEMQHLASEIRNNLLLSKLAAIFSRIWRRSSGE